MLTTERFITEVVASQIKGDDLKERSECDHLIAPGIPEVWEAMDHDNQWSLAYTRIVDFYSVIIRIMMCHVFVDVIGNDGWYCVLIAGRSRSEDRIFGERAKPGFAFLPNGPLAARLVDATKIRPTMRGRTIEFDGLASISTPGQFRDRRWR